ncbi:MAG: DEAD/DEAH box helicase [Deltaproteobacteria bacterium]|nr:DEAD/DEAH box helicase [Deltaproteobacteria bacterium]
MRVLPGRWPEGVESALNAWERPPVGPCIAGRVELPAEEARTAPMPAGLDARIVAALRRRGVEELYIHQAEAFEHARAGRNVVVSTPTASGKTLCYNLPVAQRLLEEPAARAIYLFPTKALSRDQELALRGLLGEAEVPAGVVTFDGDTPGDVRRVAREQGGVIVTNPDMLHTGILPHHPRWAKLFQNLRYVVIDELHQYRGVFGSHVANVLRRLQRVAAFHGAKPVFVCSSATIGNPRELAERLVEGSFAWVSESGAPRGARHLLIYNPPVVDAALGIRASYLKSACRLAGDLIDRKVQTLVFAQSRNAVELLVRYLRDHEHKQGRDPERISGYRGGYLPNLRREIEHGLRDGDLRCVVATNALELGIDIGALDAVILAGYPGSVAALWQRAGRAGRRLAPSVAVLVTSSSPLDQFVATQPDYLRHAGVEHGRVNPDNLEILLSHVKCAAFELPFERNESLGSLGGDGTGEVLHFLAEKKVLLDGGERYHWIADAYPAQQVGLRTVGAENFVVVDRSRDVVLGEIDFRGAHTMVHEQAVYQHAGETYQVEQLDYENRKAYVTPVDCDYYTDAQTYSRVTVLEREAEAKAAGGRVDVGWGEVRVVERVVGYKKIKFHTHENVGWGDVHLPELEMHTNGTWWTVPAALAESFELSRPALVDALHGLGYALRHVGAMKLLCDPRDIVANLSETVEGEIEAATLTLYEAYPGGVGLAEELFYVRESLLENVADLVGGCGCRGGCPSCTGPAEESSSDRRAGVRKLVRALRETGAPDAPATPAAGEDPPF